MDSKPAPQNIQDAFLNLARREKSTVTIYLVNGAKLLGRIKSFDKFSLLLETGTQEQLIFKHAISTVVMGRMVAAHGTHLTHPETKTAVGTGTSAAPVASAATAPGTGTEG